MHVAPQRCRPFRDRAGHEWLWPLIAHPFILDPEEHLTLVLSQRDLSEPSLGVPPDVAQTLRYYLEQLGCQTIVHTHIRCRFNLHLNLRGLRILTNKAAHGGQ